MEYIVNGTMTANSEQKPEDLSPSLTCAPARTIGDFWARYEEEIEEDLARSLPTTEGGSTADALCVVALLLHALLYEHRASLDDLRPLRRIPSPSQILGTSSRNLQDLLLPRFSGPSQGSQRLSWQRERGGVPRGSSRTLGDPP